MKKGNIIDFSKDEETTFSSIKKNKRRLNQKSKVEALPPANMILANFSDEEPIERNEDSPGRDFEFNDD